MKDKDIELKEKRIAKLNEEKATLQGSVETLLAEIASLKTQLEAVQKAQAQGLSAAPSSDKASDKSISSAQEEWQLLEEACVSYDASIEDERQSYSSAIKAALDGQKAAEEAQMAAEAEKKRLDDLTEQLQAAFENYKQRNEELLETIKEEKAKFNALETKHLDLDLKFNDLVKEHNEQTAAYTDLNKKFVAQSAVIQKILRASFLKRLWNVFFPVRKLP